MDEMPPCATCTHDYDQHKDMGVGGMVPCIHISRGTVGGRDAGVSAVCACRNYVPTEAPLQTNAELWQ